MSIDRFVYVKPDPMAKAKQQPSDTVVKSKTPSQLSVEQLKNDCYDLLVAMKEDGDSAKLYTTHKRETKEKLIPRLRALKSKLSRQGKKDGVDGWTTWFEENKEDFGISLRTADRWIEPKPEEKHKFANLDPADGVKINGKKFLINYKFRHSRIIGITLTPFVPEKSTAIVETQPEPPKVKLIDTRPGKKFLGEPTLMKHEIARQKRLDEAQKKITTHKMNGKRTFCGKRPNFTLPAGAVMSDTPTCINCQNGEMKSDEVQRAFLAQDAEGCIVNLDEFYQAKYINKTVPEVLSDCPTEQSGSDGSIAN
jgi:hypothetical protein